jgi:hypothetical protein
MNKQLKEYRSIVTAVLLVLAVCIPSAGLRAGEPKHVAFYLGGAFDMSFKSTAGGSGASLLYDTKANKYGQSYGGSLNFGLTMYNFDLGLEAGFSQRGFYDAYFYKQPDGSVVPIRPNITYNEIPVGLHFAYNISFGAFNIMPGIVGGAFIDFMNSSTATENLVDNSLAYGGRSARIDISAFVGPELRLFFAFPGDRVSVFLGGSYNFIIPVVKSNDDALGAGEAGNLSNITFYRFPRLNVGFRIYPKGGGIGLDSLEKAKTRFQEPLPVKLPSIRDMNNGKTLNAQPTYFPSHQVLAEMRGEKVQGGTQTQTPNWQPAPFTMPSLEGAQQELKQMKRDVNSMLNELHSTPVLQEEANK